MLISAMVVVQLMMLSHQRELLQDVAIEAASYSALADQDFNSAGDYATDQLPDVLVVSELIETAPKFIKVTLKQPGWVELEAVGYAVLENQ